MVSSLTSEKIMCAEILLLSNCNREIPGRKFTSNYFWNVLKDVTTQLEEEDDDSKNCNEKHIADVAKSILRDEDNNDKNAT